MYALDKNTVFVDGFMVHIHCHILSMGKKGYNIIFINKYLGRDLADLTGNVLLLEGKNLNNIKGSVRKK